MAVPGRRDAPALTILRCRILTQGERGGDGGAALSLATVDVFICVHTPPHKSHHL